MVFFTSSLLYQVPCDMPRLVLFVFACEEQCEVNLVSIPVDVSFLSQKITN